MKLLLRNTFNFIDEFPALILFPSWLVFFLSGILDLKTQKAACLLRAVLLLEISFLLVGSIIQIKQIRISAIALWAFLFLSFLLPGAYLEYPSDAWEHLRRIFVWQSYPTMSDNTEMNRFAYFFNFSLLKDLEIVNRRWGLSLVAAFSQWLMTFQFSRFIRSAGISNSWNWVQVIAFITLFGTNIFSMRYYALSGTLYGYAAYLGILQVLTVRSKKLLIRTAIVLMLLTLTVSNHPQTFLFSAIALVVIACYRFLEAKRIQISPFVWGGVFVLGILLGLVLKNGFFARVYGRFDPGTFSFMGGFRLFYTHSPFLETWGIHGLLSLLLSPLVWKENRLFVLLSWVPVFLLSYPPSAYFIARFFHTDTAYRLLFVFPTSVLTVLLFRKAVLKFEDRLRKLRIAPVWAGLGAIIVVAAPFWYPWRGRLFFQTYRPPAVRTLTFLDETAQWFARYPEFFRNCTLLGDDLSVFAISAQLGLKNPNVSRIPSLRLSERMQNLDDALFVLKHDGDFFGGSYYCGLLLPESSKLPAVPLSSVGGLSRHWPRGYADVQTHIDKRMVGFRDEELAKKGLVRVDVPPFYRLYVSETRLEKLK